jgi:hypothetical protein
MQFSDHKLRALTLGRPRARMGPRWAAPSLTAARICLFIQAKQGCSALDAREHSFETLGSIPWIDATLLSAHQLYLATRASNGELLAARLDLEHIPPRRQVRHIEIDSEVAHARCVSCCRWHSPCDRLRIIALPQSERSYPQKRVPKTLAIGSPYP